MKPIKMYPRLALTMLLSLLLLATPLGGLAIASVMNTNPSQGAIIGQEKATEQVANLFQKTYKVNDSNIDWSRGQVFSYKNLPVESVIFSSRNSYIKYAAYYDPLAKQFKGYYFISNLQQGKDPSQTLKGSLACYTWQGNLIAKATYGNGKLLNTVKGQIPTQSSSNSGGITPNASILNCNWTCVQPCLANTFSQLPDWLKVICDEACVDCWFDPYSCAVCLGCVLGYGYYYCFNECC